MPRDRNCVTCGLLLWPDIIRFGHVISDLVRGMSVTDFTTVGHKALSMCRELF